MRRILSIIIVLFLIGNTIAKCAVYIDTAMVTSNGRQKLLISIPDNYDVSNKYSLVVANQPCNASTYTSYVDALKPLTDSLNMIIVCPDNSGTGGWIKDENLDIITVAIDSAISICSIDEQSVYLTGMSCNGEVALHAGLNKLYPFKGIFPWAPYIKSVNPSRFDLDSDMPVIISVGTRDPYYAATLNMYKSLKTNGADVNLILVPNIDHTYSFADFGNEMIHSLQYLNDSGNISFEYSEAELPDFEMEDADTATELVFKVANKKNNELIIRSWSTYTSVLSNPEITYTASDSTVKLAIQPKVGKSGDVIIILEAKEKHGLGIKQVAFNVKVTKSLPQVTSVSTLDNNPNIDVYPNPAHDEIFVQCEEENMQVYMYDFNGKVLLKSTIENNSSLDVSSLSNGIYFLQIIGNNNNKTIKFVKQ